jgi:hypothetical protein
MVSRLFARLARRVETLATTSWNRTTGHPRVDKRVRQSIRLTIDEQTLVRDADIQRQVAKRDQVRAAFEPTLWSIDPVAQQMIQAEPLQIVVDFQFVVDRMLFDRMLTRLNPTLDVEPNAVLPLASQIDGRNGRGLLLLIIVDIVLLLHPNELKVVFDEWCTRSTIRDDRRVHKTQTTMAEKKKQDDNVDALDPTVARHGWWWLDPNDISKPSVEWLSMVKQGKKLGFTDEELAMTEIALNDDRLGWYTAAGRTPNWQLRHQDAVRWKKTGFPKAREGDWTTTVYLDVVPRVLVPYLVYHLGRDPAESIGVDVRPWAQQHMKELNKDNIEQWKKRCMAMEELQVLFRTRPLEME